jgi:hypothetical protein
MIWPNVLGTALSQNANWVVAVQIPGVRQKFWTPSLYLGNLALIVAAGAIMRRHGPALPIWLSVIVIVSLIGSLGP